MSSPVLGIDLGTTNTVVAVCGREGVEVLRDRERETLTPSIVSFMPSGEIVVGRSARERRLIDAANTVFSTKRLIGRPFRTPEVRRAVERSPFALVESDNGGVDVRVRSERYSLPEISAFVLRRARAVAEEALSKTCSHVVVTVPASFNELQRTATRDAGRIAGLHVLRILNEPTAAALAYGFGARTDKRIAIYDLGGGTFDLSILDLTGDVIEVIATAGDSYLGGDDVDTLIADRMAASFLAQHRVDLSSDPQAYERLRVAGEWLKVQLSSTERAHVRVEQAAYGAYGVPIDLEFSMTRAEHDQLLTPLVQRTFDICESAMRVASLRPTQVDEVILVGGQTMAPRVRELVQQYFGRPPLTNVNPSHVVAEGAAVLGYALTGGKPAAAPAATRARPEGSAGLNTLVPPAPSMPPPAPVAFEANPQASDFAAAPLVSIPPPSAAPVSVPVSPTFSPTPSPTAGMRPSLARAEATLTSVPAPDSSLPTRGGTLRGGPPIVPRPSAPVFPGFEDDDEEPTRIADRPGLRDRDMQPADVEPLRENTERTALYTAFDDEPTQHMPPKSDPPPPLTTSAGRESPAPRAPASGVPLAAVTLNKRPSAPPPAPLTASPRTAPLSGLAQSPLPPPPGGFKAPPAPPPPAAASAQPPPTPSGARRPPATKPPASRAPAITAPPPASSPRPPAPVSPASVPPPHAPLPRPAPLPTVPLPMPVASAPPPPVTATLPTAVAPPAAPHVAVTAPLFEQPPVARPSAPTPRPSPAPAVSPLPPRPAPAPAPEPASLAPQPVTEPMRQEMIEAAALAKPASIPPPAIDIELPRPPLLLDVTPLTLAIETAGGYCEPIIERNAPIPTEQTRRFSTSQDNQVSVRMRICQGEERRADKNQLLGTIELSELRAAARGAVKIEVTFMIDADGTLSVRARDEATRKAHRIRIDLVGGLREEDVTRMYKRQKALNVRG